MIRFIIKTIDTEAAAHVAGENARVDFTTVDLNVPALEAVMVQFKDRLWIRRELVGIELVPDESKPQAAVPKEPDTQEFPAFTTLDASGEPFLYDAKPIWTESIPCVVLVKTSDIEAAKCAKPLGAPPRMIDEPF